MPPSIRASSFTSATTCPASVWLSQGLRSRGIEPVTTYTDIGTLGHEALGRAMVEGPEALDHVLKDNPTLRQEVHEFWEYLASTDLVVLDGSCPQRIESPMVFPVGRDEDQINITGTRDLVQLQPDDAVVVDWKFYNDPSDLPVMSQDMQMIIYALGTALELGIDRVVVHRALVYHRRIETLVMDRELLDLAFEAISEESDRIHVQRARFVVGAHCSGCLLRRHCDAYRGLDKHVGEEIVPYRGQPFQTTDDVRSFVLAQKVMRERLDEGLELARRWVEEHGPLFDPASGEQWGPIPWSQDHLLDVPGALAELSARVGREGALRAMETSKTALAAELKAAGIKEPGRRAFLQRLRDRGMMRKEETVQWRWRKRK